MDKVATLGEIERFAAFACLLELAFAKKEFKEDEKLHLCLFQLLIQQPPNAKEIVAMDIVFADLMRIHKVGDLFCFMVPCRGKEKGNFPRSICLFHIMNQANYKTVYQTEGATRLPERLVNRAIKF
jgi:hypothetical protein